MQGPAGGPFAETLEARRHFDVTASLNTMTHVLTITGDINNNTITVYQLNMMVDKIKVKVSGASPDLGPWDVTDIDLIKLNGGSGSETLVAESNTLGTLVNGDIPVSEPMEFYGNSGNDSIVGSDGADMIDGGPDNDSMNGRNGSDTMYGGNGSDQLQDDNDSASDFMYGGAGSDTFRAEDCAFDYIDGGTESDTLVSSDTGLDTILNVP